MDFTRLECKEILANLNTGTCDEEVVAKLLAGTKAKTVEGDYLSPHAVHKGDHVHVAFDANKNESHVVSIDRVSDNAKRVIPIVPKNVDWDVYTEADMEAFNHSVHALGLPEEQTAKMLMTQNDVATINEQRRVTWETQTRAKVLIESRGEAYSQMMTGPEIPAAARIERRAIGELNTRGEKCIAVDPDSGCSTYVCRNGHGYVDNNPTTAGCPTCFLTGEMGGASSTTAVRVDDGAIEGYESNW